MAKTIKQIQGWSFATLSEFEASRSSLDETLGLPIVGNTTTTSMQARENRDEEERLVFYYVGFNPQLEIVLGDPITLDIYVTIPDALPPLT